MPTPLRFAGKRARDPFTYTGSLVVTKRSKMSQLVEVGEYTRRRLRTGRNKRKTLRRAHQLIKNTWGAVYLRASTSNTFCNTNGGALKLWNYFQNSVLQHTPMHFWNLNPGLGTGSTDNPVGGYNCFLSGTNSVNFAPITIKDPNGLAVTQYSLESQVAGDIYGKAYQWHKWTDIRLLCYGAKNMPVRYDIMVCRFTEEMHHPGWIQEILTSSTSAAPTTFELYAHMIQPFVRNPVDIATPHEEFRRICKVIRRTSFVLQTPSTTEGDGAPHMREVKWFIKQDRVADHRYKPAEHLTLQDIGSDKYPVQTSNPAITNSHYNMPHWNERLFLVIRATAQEGSGVSGPSTTDVTYTPSYDVCIRHRVS